MNGGERADPFRVRLEVEERAERADDERHRPLDRRIAEIAGAQVEPRSATPSSAAAARATASMPSDESTPMTSTPAWAIGIAILPVPTPSSTTGPPERFASST